MSNFLLLLLAFALVLLNAFFVAAEFGMVKLRNTRVAAIKEMYGLRGQILAQIHQHLDAYLSGCQLGITLASLGLGWVGEPAVAQLLEPVFHRIGNLSLEWITALSFLISFFILSFLHIVIGELMPKSLAIRQSETVSVWTAIPLYGFYWLMYPLIWLLNTCSNILLRWTRLDTTHQGENFFSSDEIRLILNASRLHGELTREETEIIQRTMDFADLRVPEVMRPLEEMVALDIEQPIAQSVQTILKHRYSRYPIYRKNENNIIGIVHVKDLFAQMAEQNQIDTLEPLVRPILKVSRLLPALDLLRKFREGMPHFALVYSGKDRCIGFITLDNLLHILIGRIKDEFHKTQDDWVVNADGTLTVKGDCSIYSLERALSTDIEIDEEEEQRIDTLMGLIIHRLHSLPKQGDRIEFKEFTAEIEKVRRSFVEIIKIYPKPPKSNE